MSYYIKQIIAKGHGKRDSCINFSKGCNIIYGPSNTGKTYIAKCIDYMCGAKNIPFDKPNGYTTIQMSVQTDSGLLIMCREIGKSYIQLHSTDRRFISGKYTINSKDYEKTISSIWLRLIGIKSQHSIIKNENYDRQRLSWQTFRHLFFLTAEKLISETSVFLPAQVVSNTAAISSLIFLLTGEDFSNQSEIQESKIVRDAKRAAIREYINAELSTLAERDKELRHKMNSIPTVNISGEIETILRSIENYEQKLNAAFAENRYILGELHEKK